MKIWQNDIRITSRKFIFVALIMILLSVVFLTGCFDDVKNIYVDVDAPLKVNQNEEFIFTVTVENLAEENQLLYSIDVWDKYLSGITIIKSTPPFTDSFHIPVDNTQCYEYKLDIPPNDSISIQFQAVGSAIGQYSSYLDVCINKGSSFISMPIITTVE